MRLVRFEDGKLEIALEPSARKTHRAAISQRKISEWTGRRWMVVVSAEAGRADGEFAEPRRNAASWSRACAPTRWCRRCWRAFPAPRSSACAGATMEHADAAPPAGDEPLPNPDDYGADDDDR